MSLRARLVFALLALLATGMTVYGVASYQAFASSELGRLDEQVLHTLPIIERELLTPVGPSAGRGGGKGDGYPGGSDGPLKVVVAPGTYAELRDAAGTLVGTPIQIADDRTQPDLSSVDLGGTDDGFWTVPSLDGETSWRVAVDRRPDGLAVLVGVPMTSLEQALGRLLAIELTAGAALLVALGVGAWFVLRSGLRPLERIASTARSITAGSLQQRVPTPAADTEIRALALALNRMLDDLEQAFDERQATEARLRRFLSDASHELRTPLTSIQGYAELFRLGAGSDEVDLDLVMRRIEGESARMRELVENLLALARLDEATEPAWESVDLVVLAADACSDAAAVDPDRAIALDAPEPVLVQGDTSHLRQAVGNLITNALRHTPAGSPISVAVTRIGDRAVLQVRDHGHGLDLDTIEHAFDRFWQADPSRAGSGTGLGLSIVQAIAEEHGGTATAANAPDGGAVFTVEIPTDHDRSAAGAPAADREPEPDRAR